MKVLVIILSLFTISFGRIENDLFLEERVEYIKNYAIPLAEKIRKVEEKFNAAKIVGGSHASSGQFLFKAGLLIYYRFAKIGICSGSLLSKDRVLTAAHCWKDISNQGISITVVLGSDKIYSGGTRLDSTEVILAVGYNPRYRWNDVAMICLPSEVTFSDTIQPVNLPSGSQYNEHYAGETANATGFGVTSDNGIISQDQTLNWIEVNVIPNQMCKSAYLYKIFSSNICTIPKNSPKHHPSTISNTGNTGNSGNSEISGNPTSKGNICYGDDGGSLVIERNGATILIGIASFISDKGCSAGLPAVYTRVTAYLQFIKQNLGSKNKT